MNIDQLRSRIVKKHENYTRNNKAYHSPIHADKKILKNQYIVDGITDDIGQPIKVNHVKTEKLPSVAGY